MQVMLNLQSAGHFHTSLQAGAIWRPGKITDWKSHSNNFQMEIQFALGEAASTLWINWLVGKSSGLTREITLILFQDTAGECSGVSKPVSDVVEVSSDVSNQYHTLCCSNYLHF